MSRYNFTLKPSGSIAPDVDLKVNLPAALAPAVSPVTEATPVIPAFCGWVVSTIAGYTLGGPFRVHEDAPYWVIGYRDTNFEFLIEAICAPPYDLTWSYVDEPSGLPNLAITPEVGESGGARLIHTSHSASYTDSAIAVHAFLGGVPWGVPIYFSEGGKVAIRYLEGSTYASIFESGLPAHVDQYSAGVTIDIIPTQLQLYLNYTGPLQAGEDVIFNITDAPAELTTATEDPDSSGHIHQLLINTWTPYASGLVGTSFTVDAVTSISGIAMPTVTYYYAPTHSPMQFFAAWDLARSSGPGAGDTYPATDYTTYNKLFLNGYVWGDPTSVALAATQLSGPSRPLTITYQGYFRYWKIERTSGLDYTGTSYQIDATIGGLPFGDPAYIACEV